MRLVLYYKADLVTMMVRRRRVNAETEKENTMAERQTVITRITSLNRRETYRSREEKSLERGWRVGWCEGEWEGGPAPCVGKDAIQINLPEICIVFPVYFPGR